MSRYSDPASEAVVITPSDAVPLVEATDWLYVGGTGDVTAIMASGQTVTFKAMPVGLYPLRLKQVKATGTTATNLLALA